jgi:hypothetical protein
MPEVVEENQEPPGKSNPYKVRNRQRNLTIKLKGSPTRLRLQQVVGNLLGGLRGVFLGGRQ